MTLADLNLGFALPELFLTAALFGMLMFGVFRGQDRVDLVVGGTIAALLGTLVLTIVVPVPEGGSAFAGLFVADGVARFSKVLILGAATLVLWMTGPKLAGHGLLKFEYPILMGFAVLGMMLMVSASDMLSLYLGLELQSLALYVLAAFNRNDSRASEAGLKYFILGALSSGVLLYGISLIYGFGGAGSTNFAELHQTIAVLGSPTDNLGLTIGLVFVAAGLGFKISAAPFHMWTPDVYQGSPLSVTAFFASAPKVAAFVLLFRVLYDPLVALAEQWQDLLILLALISVFWGAIAGVAQRSLKRLIAYSSIGHMGYALLGLAAGNADGGAAMLSYLTAYVIMTVGVFSLVMSMERDGREVETIDDLAGLGKADPFKAIALLILMMSLAGIPIFAGFFVKVQVFYAAVSAGFEVAAVLAVIGSVIACFYYIRLVKIAYFDLPEGEMVKVVENRPSQIVLIASLACISLWAFGNRALDEAARGSISQQQSVLAARISDGS